jgi:hypothetical protein
VWFSPNQIHLLESQCIAASQRWATRLTDDHDGEVCAPFGDDFVFLHQVSGKDTRDREIKNLVG